MNESKVVHHHIYNPTNSLFKAEPNAKAESHTIVCSNEECVLLLRGQCHLRHLLSGGCPYGKYRTARGFTKRARNFYSWIRDREKENKDVPSLTCPPDKIEFIGDYVYLPYSHMDKSSFLKNNFLPKENWTLETVVGLMNFIPTTFFFNNAIEEYQRDVIPRFLVHLKEKDENMWWALMEKMPHLNREISHVGRKAYLSTLNYPIEWLEKDEVLWKWDGNKLTTCSLEAYANRYGMTKLESLELTAIPVKDSIIEVQSNDWVNENTKFLD